MAMHEETTLVKKHGPYAGMRVLEVGSSLQHSKEIRDATQGCAEHIGVDQMAHQFTNVVHDLLQPLTDQGEFDVVLCFSVLEHTPKPWVLAANVEALLKPGGLMLVSVPFQWRVHNHPDDYFRYTPSGLRSLFPNIEPSEEFSIPAVKLESHQNGKIQLFLVGRKK